MGGLWLPMSLECWHGGERRTRWSRQGRNDLGRHRRSGWTAGLVARFIGWDTGRRLYRLLMRETGGHCGKSGRRALRTSGWGLRRARVRARVHARGTPGRASVRVLLDRHGPLGSALFAYLSLSAL